MYNGIDIEKIVFDYDSPLTVTGIVVKTGISIYATPYVSLSDKAGGKVYATCVLPRTDALKLRDFKKGEKATMRGNYYAFHGK